MIRQVYPCSLELIEACQHDCRMMKKQMMLYERQLFKNHHASITCFGLTVIDAALICTFSGNRHLPSKL